MRFYLDASVLVALLTEDPSAERADRLIRSKPSMLLVSDLATAEFVSALSRRVRVGQMAADKARLAFATLDNWMTKTAQRLPVEPGDVRRAEDFMRRLNLTLRTQDAIHIAIAQRAHADFGDVHLATFDAKMAACAEALGSHVVTA